MTTPDEPAAGEVHPIHYQGTTVAYTRDGGQLTAHPVGRSATKLPMTPELVAAIEADEAHRARKASGWRDDSWY